VGEACQTSTQCRAGLTCDSAKKTCVPSGNVVSTGGCELSASCAPGNYCTQEGRCEASGTGALDAACSAEGDCQSGLVCVQSGLTGVCKPAGTGDLGSGCVDASSCLGGLLCIAGRCSKAIQSFWSGVICPANDETTAKVYFHVPRATETVGNNSDFYRLPFPNDIRMKNGRIDLAGHPRPGARIFSFDLVERVISAIQTDSSGFGANQAVYFRLSKNHDPSRSPGDCGARLVDITPSSDTYALTLGTKCEIATSHGRYICGPWLWVRPALGSPLRPGTTYAVLVKKTIYDTLGMPFGPDSDFSAMLADTAPVDSDLAAAHRVYQPLRDFLADDKVPAASRFVAADLASAAVFTVEKYEDPLAAIDTAVATAATTNTGNPVAVDGGTAAAPTPENPVALDAALPAAATPATPVALDAAAPAAPVFKIENFVRCGDPGVVSPCDDGKTQDAHLRGCVGADSASASFHEYQGTMALPIFQQGTPPYLTPADGGKIQYRADGSAIIQDVQRVCFVLTVPKGTMPASGWPLVVYSHGTGGSYRSVVALGLADDFAKGAAPAGVGIDGGAGATSVPTATLGYDGVLHGTRNGGSTAAVGELVYNFLNPPAARDNALQAAADLLAIPSVLPGLAEHGIAIDSKRLMLYGHSQGGNAASLVAARPSKYGAIVMSGTGGTLAYTLTGKSQPVNIPAVLPYLLGEPGSAAVGVSHPVINLMQMYFERSDSVNFARRLFWEPLPSVAPFHCLHVYGKNDSYSVVATQQAFALAAHFRTAPPLVDEYTGVIALPPTSLPAHLNEFFGSYPKVTALQIQYQPTGAYDGHFVSTQNPSARAAIQEMLITFARDGVPTVSP